MARIKQAPVSARSDQVPEPEFAFHQREVPKVFVIEPEQIEAVEDRVGFPPPHVQKDAAPLRVQAYNFSIDDGILDREFRQSRVQRRETLELILFSRYQSAFSVFDIGQASPTVHLQFKDKLSMVKRSLYPFRSDGLDARELHGFSLPSLGSSCFANAYATLRLCRSVPAV